MPTARPLVDASARLRRPAGRPRRVLAGAVAGSPDQRSPLTPAPDAGPGAVFAATVLPRGLSVKDAAAYVGVSVRELWRKVERGELRVVRWPGCRRAIFDRQDLDHLFAPAFKVAR